MPHLIVASEGDMEYGLKYTTAIALDSREDKFVTLTFPSFGFMQLFMNNLFKSFITNQVPMDNKLNLTINIPPQEDHSHDEPMDYH